jgi:hypothetical protein
MIKRINPIAKTMLQDRRRNLVVPDKTKYNRKKENKDAWKHEHRKGEASAKGQEE